MNSGPLRRTTGTIGLIALAPVAAMLALGMLSAEEAAMRAIIVALLVVVLGRMAQTALRGMLHRVERSKVDDTPTPDTVPPTAQPGSERRRNEAGGRGAGRS